MVFVNVAPFAQANIPTQDGKRAILPSASIKHPNNMRDICLEKRDKKN